MVEIQPLNTPEFEGHVYGREHAAMETLIQGRRNLSAVVTMALAQSGVCLRSRGLSIFPCSMRSTSLGLGVLPAAGSPSALLS